MAISMMLVGIILVIVIFVAAGAWIILSKDK